MENKALFNTGFIGDSFLWWVGQIADDSTWRENINPGKFKKIEDIPGWGYRYKVRIIGYHDQAEDAIESDQLPWAQVMYPITAGGGQGGSVQTPAIKQGNFVFGFFLDGQDQQVPVIMGILGNNPQTGLEMKMGTSGGNNFTPQSHNANGSEKDRTKKVADENLASEKRDDGEIPTKESPVGVHQETASDKKREDVYTKKHALVCPDPHANMQNKAIDTAIENLTKKIEKSQKVLSSYADAVSLPTKEARKTIDDAVGESAKEISYYMRTIIGRVQNYSNQQFNDQTRDLLKISIPSSRIKLLEKNIDALNTLSCTFNNIFGSLEGIVGDSLASLLRNKKNNSKPRTSISSAAPTSTSPTVGIGTTQNIQNIPEATIIDSPQEGSVDSTIPQISEIDPTVSEIDPTVSEVQPDTLLDIPPLPPEGYYSPTPLCSSEELIGEVLGRCMNDIMSSYEGVIGPVVTEISDSISKYGSDSGRKLAGSSPTRRLQRTQGTGRLNNENVSKLAKSGKISDELTTTLASAFGVTSNASEARDYFRSNNFEAGLASLASLSGRDVSSISKSINLIGKGDLINGFESLKDILDVGSGILNGIGSAFDAIKSGNISGLVSSLNKIGNFNPSILNALTGSIPLNADSIIGNIGGSGPLGGMNMDIASAVGFFTSVSEFFDCDAKPDCSPNDTLTLQAGGSGKPGTVNPAEIARQATETVSKMETGLDSIDKLISKGSEIVQKKFNLPEGLV